MSLIVLPEYLFFVIHTFITFRPTTIGSLNDRPIHYNPDYECDCSVDRENDNERSWLNFLNATREFHALKIKTNYLLLNETYSLQYFADKFLRHSVNRVVGAIEPFFKDNATRFLLSAIKKHSLFKVGRLSPGS
jgi:hypothetical protein